MKTKLKQPGGRLKALRSDNHQVLSELRKIFSPKEAKLKQDILHIRLHIRRELGREAAYDDRCEEEECRDLAGEFTRESAKKTDDAIADVRERYETIVSELLAARYSETDGKPYSLCTVLRSKYESDSALKEFLPKFAKWIREYVSDCINEHTFVFTPLYRQIVPGHTWTLSGHSVSKELLTVLAQEYVRDRQGLMRFLQEVFKRWRKINQPGSLFRQRLLTHQLAGTPKEIANALELIGAVATSTTEHQFRSLCSSVRQYRSRDPKAALKRRGL
jgi:hypothetical protein